MEVRRGGSKHAAVGPEYLPLNLDGEVAELALLPLTVQVVQDSSAGPWETHLNRGVAAGRIHAPELQAGVPKAEANISDI